MLPQCLAPTQQSSSERSEATSYLEIFNETNQAPPCMCSTSSLDNGQVFTQAVYRLPLPQSFSDITLFSPG